MCKLGQYQTWGAVMTPETRTTDAMGRVCLLKAFADATVIIAQVSEKKLRIHTARVVPEAEIRCPEEASHVLSDRDRDRFLELLDHSPKPNTTLRRAAARHAKKQR